MSGEGPAADPKRAASPGFRARMRGVRSTAKRELAFYRAVSRHPATPRLAKVLMGAALAYLVSPVDLIPDLIPVIGHLDDAIIVPGLIVAALRLIPEEVLVECRRTTAPEESATAAT